MAKIYEVVAGAAFYSLLTCAVIPSPLHGQNAPVLQFDRLPPAPAFLGQTRAPAPAEASTYRVEIIATGLDAPWSLAFLPDGTMLVTERAGRIHAIDAHGTISPPLSGLPAVRGFRDKGLTDIRLTLNQARHDLRMKTVGPSNVVVDQGRVFDYFDEIRKVVELATQDVFFIDPYLDAEFVAKYLGHVTDGVTIRLLTKRKLETLLPAPLVLAAKGARLVALIKPQFEVGKDQVGKGGVVRDPELHEEVCARIEAWLGGREGWRVLGLTESPILGPEGNKEFLIAAAKEG